MQESNIVKLLQTVIARMDSFEEGVNKRLNDIDKGQQETNKRLTAIEATVNDLKVINRRTQKEVFSQLNAIWDDVKSIENRLEVQEKKAIQ